MTCMFGEGLTGNILYNICKFYDNTAACRKEGRPTRNMNCDICCEEENQLVKKCSLGLEREPRHSSRGEWFKMHKLTLSHFWVLLDLSGHLQKINENKNIFFPLINTPSRLDKHFIYRTSSPFTHFCSTWWFKFHISLFLGDCEGDQEGTMCNLTGQCEHFCCREESLHVRTPQCPGGSKRW